MFASGKKGIKLFIKADQQSYDFTISDFTTNYTYHDLDLSSIIPVGTKAIFLWGSYKSESADAELTIANADYTGTYLKDIHFEPVANIGEGFSGIIPVSNDRKIQYRASDVIYTYINLNVVAWFI